MNKKKRICIILSLLLSLSLTFPIYAGITYDVPEGGSVTQTTVNGAEALLIKDKNGKVVQRVIKQGTKYKKDTDLQETKTSAEDLAKKEALSRDKIIVSAYKGTKLFPEEYFVRGISANLLRKSLSTNGFITEEMRVVDKNLHYEGKTGNCKIDLVRRSYFDTEGAKHIVRDDIYSIWEYFGKPETAVGSWSRLSNAAYVEIPNVDWNNGKCDKGSGRVFRFIYHNGYNHIEISGDISARDTMINMVKSWGLYKRDLPLAGYVDFTSPVYNSAQELTLKTLAEQYKNNTVNTVAPMVKE